MTTRGKTLRSETPGKLTLLRPMITRRYELAAEYDKCCGCDICELVCPPDAITLRPPQVVNGRTLVSPKVDIDPDKCSLCGECVVLCPTHALSMTVNGKAEVPVLKGEAFPMLVRLAQVEQGPCEATTDTSYIDRCPTGAISAEVSRDASGGVVAVRDVKLDRQVCINCTHCMEQGPKGAFKITKPYKGRFALNTALCPAGCQACADVCPSDAIAYDGQRVSLDPRFCLFCGACENVCPAEGAIRIWRSGFVHTPIESAAWGLALEALVSYREYVREMDTKSQDRRRKLIVETLLQAQAKEE